jgi:hypothetical protein
MGIERILGYVVNVRKTDDEYTISGPDVRGFREELIDRGFKPGEYQPDLKAFTICENDIIGSHEATRLKLRLNSMASKLDLY